METVAQLSNIITAAIAMIASLTGGIWWFCVRQRRSKRVMRDVVEIGNMFECTSDLLNKAIAVLENDKSTEFEKSRALLMLIDRRISDMNYLFFLHFIHSNFRPHEIPNLLKLWKLRSPVQWPMERRDVERPKSSE